MAIVQLIYYFLVASIFQIVTQVYGLPTIELSTTRYQESVGAVINVLKDGVLSCDEITCQPSEAMASSVSGQIQFIDKTSLEPTIGVTNMPTQATTPPPEIQVLPTEVAVDANYTDASVAESPVTTDTDEEITPTTEPQIVGVEQISSATIQDKVNDFRLQHGKNELSERPDLCEITQLRAAAAADNFSHDGFEAAVKAMTFEKVAENLWQGNPFDLDLMIKSWENSSGHRDNLLGDWVWGCGRQNGNTVAYIFLR